MRKLRYILLCVPFIGLAQVGIGIAEPTKTLDIAGDLRIREITEGDAQSDFVVVTNKDGDVQVKDIKTFGEENEAVIRPAEKAYDVIVDINKDPMGEAFSPSLDLWSDQELYGEENLKDVYFLGLRQRVTLPANKTTVGNGKIRKITFVIIRNNQIDGFGDSIESETFDSWYVVFQTKKFEFNPNTLDNCVVNDQTYLYDPYKYSSLFVPDPEGAYIAVGNDATNARIKMRYQAQISDRAVVFYDFNGKWIISVRD